jgi:hypothetical protein
VKREQAKEEGELLLSVILKQEELAFIKAVGSMELSPVLLRELRKAMAAAKKKKAISATPSHASASALVHPGGAGGGVWTPLTQCSPTYAKERLRNFQAKTARLSQPPAALRPGIRSKTGPRHRAPRAN